MSPVRAGVEVADWLQQGVIRERERQCELQAERQQEERRQPRDATAAALPCR
jgi:hypothetical protein